MGIIDNMLGLAGLLEEPAQAFDAGGFSKVLDIAKPIVKKDPVSKKLETTKAIAKPKPKPQVQVAPQVQVDPTPVQSPLTPEQEAINARLREFGKGSYTEYGSRVLSPEDAALASKQALVLREEAGNTGLNQALGALNLMQKNLGMEAEKARGKYESNPLAGVTASPFLETLGFDKWAKNVTPVGSYDLSQLKDKFARFEEISKLAQASQKESADLYAKQFHSMVGNAPVITKVESNRLAEDALKAKMIADANKAKAAKDKTNTLTAKQKEDLLKNINKANFSSNQTYIKDTLNGLSKLSSISPADSTILKNWVTSGNDIPELLANSALSPQIKGVMQSYMGVLNPYIHSISGSAVSKQELARMLTQSGLSAGASVSSIKKGITDLIRKTNEDFRNTVLSAHPEVLDLHKQRTGVDLQRVYNETNSLLSNVDNPKSDDGQKYLDKIRGLK